MEEEIQQLKRRIEELEKRPQYIPVYPPIQITAPAQCTCGRSSGYCPLHGNLNIPYPTY